MIAISSHYVDSDLPHNDNFATPMYFILINPSTVITSLTHVITLMRNKPVVAQLHYQAFLIAEF